MNYEQKYKEALETAKAFYRENKDFNAGFLHNIFPELKESEEERIRKGLIKAVSRIFKGNKLFDTDVTREEEIKKQAEKKAHEPSRLMHPYAKQYKVMSAYEIGFIEGVKWADEHPHWISVDDELPKDKELVFITDGEYTDTGFYGYTFDEWQPCEKWLGDITHWMPLPQAPKKGGEK